MNGFGRPKEFFGKKEDFKPWVKKMEAFFAGEIKESEMTEWAADQTMEIATTAIDLEFLPTESNGGRGVRNLKFVLQHMHEMLRTRTSQEANGIVANSRKKPLEGWRRPHERYDPTTGGRKRNILRATISQGRCSLQELQAGIETLGTQCLALREEAEGQVRRRGPAGWPGSVGARGA